MIVKIFFIFSFLIHYCRIMLVQGRLKPTSPLHDSHPCRSLRLVCLAALCHYYGPICVNANIPFIIARNGFRQESRVRRGKGVGGWRSGRGGSDRIPHLSHFHHGGIRSAVGSEVRVPDLLSDH